MLVVGIRSIEWDYYYYYIFVHKWNKILGQRLWHIRIIVQRLLLIINFIFFENNFKRNSLNSVDVDKLLNTNLLSIIFLLIYFLKAEIFIYSKY